MHNENGPSPPSPDRRSHLRVFRIEQGQRFVVRFLSVEYVGLVVHWERGQSVYCPGPQYCPPARHRQKAFWKGYCHADVFNAPDSLYYPVCFEITEHLEMRLRDVYERGQLWDIWRLPDRGKKKEGVDGTLIGQHPPDVLPAELPIWQTLQHLYHVTELDLTRVNPLPPRPLAEPTSAPLPPMISPSEKAADEKMAAGKLWKELLKRFKQKNGSNGHPPQTATEPPEVS